MKNVIYLETTTSTNRDAFEYAVQGAEHGTAVIADTQLNGRGRLGKTWRSPAGKGMYCSIILRPKVEPQNYPLLTFVAGLAVADAIEKLYGLSAGLKWPNDIYFKGRKCGGILTESSDLNGIEESRFAIVGIGLNVNTELNDFHPELHETATSLYLESDVILDVKTVFLEIRQELIKQVKSFEKTGFLPVINRWRTRDFLYGSRLAWVSVGGRKVEGVSLGPDDEGRLHVEDDSGKIHEVMSGDIRLCK